MAIKGGQRVAEIWGTDLYIDDEDLIPSMVSVELPPNNLTRWNSTKYAQEKTLWLRVDWNSYGDVVARFSTKFFMNWKILKNSLCCT